MNLVRKCMLPLLGIALLTGTFVSCGSDDETPAVIPATNPETTPETNPEDLSQTDIIYAVKFDLAGLNTETITNVQKPENSTFTKAEIPDLTGKLKSGYTIEDWYTDALYQTKLTSFTVTRHITIYAKFLDTDGKAVNVNTVLYQTDYSYMDAKNTTQTTLVPSFLTAPPESFDNGYYFQGWYDDTAYATRTEPCSALSGAKKLYAKWGTLTADTSATFDGLAFSQIGADLYARTKSSTDDGNTTGEPIYEKRDSAIQEKMYQNTGVVKTDGALVYSKSFNVTYAFKQEGSGENKTLTQNVSYIQLGNCLNSSNITLPYNLLSYIQVQPTGAGTVTATVKNARSSSVTGTSNAKALLIDSSGTVLASQAIDNSNGATSTTYTVSCSVTKSEPIYLAFGKYGDAGGSLNVKKIEFTAN